MRTSWPLFPGIFHGHNTAMPVVPISPQPDAFPATRWSVVAAAGERSAAALEELCSAYWRPLYAHARRRGLTPSDADDQVQDFFCRLLERDGVAQARQSRGRFRTFLLCSFSNHLRDAYDHATAQKRDVRRLLWLDAFDAEARLAHEPVAAASPEAAFDRAWALRVLDLVMAELAEACGRTGRGRQFVVFKPVLAGAVEPDIAALAADLGMSPGAAKVALHRLREHWRTLLRERVADTVADPADVDDELRHLVAAVSVPAS